MERTRRTTPHQIEVLSIAPPPAVDLTVLQKPRTKTAKRCVDLRWWTTGPSDQTKNKRRRGRPHKRKR